MSKFLKTKANLFKTSVVNLFKRKKKVDIELAETANKEVVVKETLRKKAVAYIKLVINDYREVGKDSIKYMNENPFKALGYGLSLTALVVFYKKNPDETSYHDARRLYMNDMIMCGKTFSKKAEYYLNELSKMDNKDLFEYKSFIFFSFMLARSASPYDAGFENHCAELNNPSRFNILNWSNKFFRFLARVVDIGFCQKWYYLEKRLIDYDVSENEWKK